jgi:hypothetical protein
MAGMDAGLNNCLKFFAKQKTSKPKNGRMPFLGSARDRIGIKTLKRFYFRRLGLCPKRQPLGQRAFLLERIARFFAGTERSGGTAKNAPKIQQKIVVLIYQFVVLPVHPRHNGVRRFSVCLPRFCIPFLGMMLFPKYTVP